MTTHADILDRFVRTINGETTIVRTIHRFNSKQFLIGIFILPASSLSQRCDMKRNCFVHLAREYVRNRSK